VTTLEQLIDEAARSGRLAGLTLWPSNGRWQASTTEDRIGWRVEIDADPVEALRRALSEKPTDTTTQGSIFD
jgi:hypothetical protein